MTWLALALVPLVLGTLGVAIICASIALFVATEVVLPARRRRRHPLEPELPPTELMALPGCDSGAVTRTWPVVRDDGWSLG